MFSLRTRSVQDVWGAGLTQEFIINFLNNSWWYFTVCSSNDAHWGTTARLLFGGTKAVNKGNEVFSSAWDRNSGGIKAHASYSMWADTEQYI